jgi:hypothetical protein
MLASTVLCTRHNFAQVNSSYIINKIPFSFTNFEFSFKTEHISSDLFILFRRPAVKSPQTEKMGSTKACDTGADSRSSARPMNVLYC